MQLIRDLVAEGELSVVGFQFSVDSYQLSVFGYCYTLPARRLAPSLKQSTGLFFNARPGYRYWDTDDADLCGLARIF